MSLMANSYFHTKEADNENWIIQIDDMLRDCDLDGVRDAFTAFLASIPYEANKDERAKDFETHRSIRADRRTAICSSVSKRWAKSSQNRSKHL